MWIPRISVGRWPRKGLVVLSGCTFATVAGAFDDVWPWEEKYVAPPAIAAAIPARASSAIIRRVRRRLRDCRRRSRKRSLGSIRSWRNIERGLQATPVYAPPEAGFRRARRERA